MKCNRQHWSLTVLILSISILLSACGTSSDVVSDNLLQKRKYRKGFHFNGHGKPAVKRGEMASLEAPGLHEMELRSRFETRDDAAAQVYISSKRRDVLTSLSNAAREKIGKVNELAQSKHFPVLIRRVKMRNVEPYDEGEEQSRQAHADGLAALLFGIGAWFLPTSLFLLASIIPGLGILAVVGFLLGLVLAILGFVYGIRSKKDSVMGLVGFVLSLVWLILAALYVIGMILLIIFFISMFGA